MCWSNYNTFLENKIVNNEVGLSLDDSDGNQILKNDITSNMQRGIGFDSIADNNYVVGNNITHNGAGINFYEGSAGNHIYNNNFINNTCTGYQTGFNVWDDGYPSGGNYWNDHTNRVDDYSGLYQNVSGRDGIADQQYDLLFVSSEPNFDRYPIVSPIPNPPWEAVPVFSFNPNSGIVNESIAFNASNSFDTDGLIVQYKWNFGDGNSYSSSGCLVNHSYASASEYGVTLTVTDDQGFFDSLTQLITIGRIPTTLTVSTDCSSTFLGYSVNVAGELQDAHGDFLDDELIVLYYTFAGITTWTPITSAATDELGRYSIDWIPPATGYFVLKAEWSGTTEHMQVSNTTTLSSLNYNNQYVFSVESNSTILELAFNTTDWTLRFDATGPNGTEGYVRVTVAKSLVTDIANIRVYVDGSVITNYSIASLDDSWVMTIHYSHSAHQISVDLDIYIISELKFWSMLLLLILVGYALASVYRSRAISNRQPARAVDVSFL